MADIQGFFNEYLPHKLTKNRDARPRPNTRARSQYPTHLRDTDR